MAKKRKNIIGRPTDLTPAVVKKIAAAVAAGNTRHDAARAAGIGKTTLWRWLQQGRRAKSGPFREFREAIDAAEAEAVARNVATIQKAANERDETTTKSVTYPDGSTRTERVTKRVFDWAAAAWWLERVRPDDWSAQRDKIRELERLVGTMARQIAELTRGTPRSDSQQGPPGEPPGRPGDPDPPGRPPGPGGGGPDGRPGDGLPPGGPDPGPVAGGVPPGPVRPPDDVVLPPQREGAENGYADPDSDRLLFDG